MSNERMSVSNESKIKNCQMSPASYELRRVEK